MAILILLLVQLQHRCADGSLLWDQVQRSFVYVSYHHILFTTVSLVETFNYDSEKSQTLKMGNIPGHVVIMPAVLSLCIVVVGCVGIGTKIFFAY